MFRKYGLTVPFLANNSLAHHIASRTRVQHNELVDDFMFVSDEENEDEDSELSEESEEESLETEATSEVESFADEFEVVDDSDFESGDENDQNVINIQLTSPSTRYSLRERVSCSPARSFSKLSQSELERHLENERDKRLCVVCQYNPKNVLILPCKHMCMCVACAHEIATSSNHSRRICPLCRSRIDTVMDVFV
ncbi:hypothetical protein LSH36_538g02060 [Paralvinella palmiformis]|uniref:RING-type domain-containing protein n=1 Tax=Paralvinella palmiformis TaxID=53620 RepID=A0AAD9MYK2_9ANNE|nr:hypothetical protein LSH36_538g02060 [Paralvinella palmiformis]